MIVKCSTPHTWTGTQRWPGYCRKCELSIYPSRKSRSSNYILQAQFGARRTSSDEASPHELLLSVAPCWLTTDGHWGLDRCANARRSGTGRCVSHFKIPLHWSRARFQVPAARVQSIGTMWLVQFDCDRLSITHLGRYPEMAWLLQKL